MKKVLLILFMILIIISIQARDVFSPINLKPGDTFRLKVSIPIGSVKLLSAWDFNDVQKIDIDFQVISTDKDSIRLAIRPTNWYIFYQNKNYDHLLIRNGVKVNNYYDSNYLTYYDNKSKFFLFENNSVIASVNIQNGGTNVNFSEQSEDIDSGRSSKEWYTDILEIPKGLSMVKFDGTVGNIILDFKSIANFTISRFIQEWKKNNNTKQSLPWMIDLSSETKANFIKPSYIQLMSASFDLQPNTLITLKVPENMPEDQVFITMSDAKVKPNKKDGNTYIFNIFLPMPQRSYFEKLMLDLTPADSLEITYTELNYKITGKGSINSMYTNTIATLYQNSLLDIENEKDTKIRFNKGEAFHNSTLAQYASEMNDYWLKSAKLSFDYWYAAKRIGLYNEEVVSKWGGKLPDESEIPWFNEQYSVKLLYK